jgi:hypothetical protein
MELSSVGPYTEALWREDRCAEAAGRHLRCPNCERGEWFHALGIPPADGAQRKYRTCKVCGFCQEADGAAAYRCVMTAHVCLARIPHGRRCQYCGICGPHDWHPGCWRILPPQEIGRTPCHNCGTVLTQAYVIPWPISAP